MAVIAIHQVALGKVLDAVVAGIERLVGQELGQSVSTVVGAVTVLTLRLVVLGEVSMDIDPLLTHGMDAVIEKTPRESCLRHSSSVLTTFGTWTVFSRSPESENSTIVTSSGPPFAAFACAVLGLRSDHKIAPASAEAEVNRNVRRRTTDPSALSKSESNIVAFS